MTRTNLEALLHNASTRPTRQPSNQAAKETPKAAKEAPKAAKKPRERPKASRAPKKTNPTRPSPKGGESKGGEGKGDDKGGDDKGGDGKSGKGKGGDSGVGRGDGAGRVGRVGRAGRVDRAGGGGEGERERAPEGSDRSVALTSAHELAYVRVRREIAALSAEQVRHITVNVPAALMLALGALPRMRIFRDAMAAAFTDPPLAALDKLEDYALAAYFAHARALTRDVGGASVRVLLNEAGPLRERLLASAGALVAFGLLDAKRVAAARKGSGHLDTAEALAALGLMHADVWPTIASKTPLEKAEVERAVELGGLLLAALGRRNQGTDGSGDPAEADEQLRKAFELFRRAYEWCRYAILYLRRDEGDGDQIAPPLARSRRRVRSKPEGEPGEGEPDGADASDEGEPPGEAEGSGAD